MIPILPILIASGILKALILILLEFNFIESTSPTAFTLSFVADSTFYFMPVIIAVFAAKKYKANISLAAMLGASLIHPDFIQAVGEGQSLGTFGLDIYPAMYTSSVIPIILSVWVMSYVEAFIRKTSPKSLRTMLVPVLTMIIMVPLTFVFLAPIGAPLSSKFGQFLLWSHNTFGFLDVALLSAFIPWIVMLGMHVGTVPISLSTIEASGTDRLILPPS